MIGGRGPRLTIAMMDPIGLLQAAAKLCGMHLIGPGSLAGVGLDYLEDHETSII